MKKSILLFAFITFAVSISGFAQYEPKGKITKAESYFKTGELDKAKAEIDKAFEVDAKGKISGDPKAYYLKGVIYAAIDTTANEAFRGLIAEGNGLDIAMEAFAKEQEFEKKKNTYLYNANSLPIVVGQEKDAYWSYYLNKGIEYYNEDELETAVVQLDKALEVRPTDTISYLYGGSMLFSLDQKTKAAGYYLKYLENGGTNKLLYNDIIAIYQAEKEYDKAIEAAEVAIASDPTNSDFGRMKIQTLILAERAEEAETELKSQIANNPSDKTLHFYLGIILDEQERYDEAIESYKKAIEIDGSYYEANFNLGIIYLKEGQEIDKQLNEVDLKDKDYDKKSKEFRDKAKTEYKEAIPYFERALESKTDDTSAMEYLAYMYYYVGDKDKSEAMEEKLKLYKPDEE